MRAPAGYKKFQPNDIAQLPGGTLASVYVNRYHMLMADDLTRVSFGQSVLGELPGNWHFSITMTTADVLAMARSILDLAAARKKDAEASGESAS